MMLSHQEDQAPNPSNGAMGFVERMVTDTQRLGKKDSIFFSGYAGSGNILSGIVHLVALIAIMELAFHGEHIDLAMIPVRPAHGISIDDSRRRLNTPRSVTSSS